MYGFRTIVSAFHVKCSFKNGHKQFWKSARVDSIRTWNPGVYHKQMVGWELWYDSSQKGLTIHLTFILLSQIMRHVSQVHSATTVKHTTVSITNLMHGISMLHNARPRSYVNKSVCIHSTLWLGSGLLYCVIVFKTTNYLAVWTYQIVFVYHVDVTYGSELHMYERHKHMPSKSL